MAENNTKITKGITIKENSLTPKEIEIIPGGTANTKTTVQGSQTVNRTITLPDANDTLVGKATVDTLTNKTIDANGTGNSISNLEVADLAAGVLNVSTTLTGASDLQVPSALAVKTYVDNGLAAQNEASEITYNNTTSGLVATNVQGAIDGVEGRVDTVETGLSNHLADTIDAHDASAISNIPAGNLAATDVQGALNELQTDIDTRATSSTLTTHTSASTGVHGVTGAVVGTTDTQTLTNKDIDGGTASNTSRITLPKAAKTTLDALTRKQGTILFDTTSNKPYFDDGTNLKVIGSGSGGATNFLTNPDAETGTTSYATYKDAAQTRPENGTGGTALYTTITTTSTNPLSGTNSFLISKSANNAQGEGVGTDFTIDLASKAKVLKVELDSIVDSGTFVAGSSTTDSDLIVYLYDVTNSRLIEPSSFKFLSNSTTISDRFSATFQTSSDSTSYRLIFHVASTSTAAWALKVDNISVSPSQYVYGTPITDWQSYTPTVSGLGTGGVASSYGKWRRVGDTVEITYNWTKDGSGGSGSATVYTSAPSGILPDSSKAPNSANLSSGEVYSTLTTRYVHLVDISTGSAYLGNVGAGTLLTGSSVTAGVNVRGSFEFPVLGWSSSVQMSDVYDGRVVAARMSKNANQSIPNAVFTKLTWEASTLNTADISNLTNDRFDIKTAGIYVFNVQTVFDVNATGFREVSIYKSGNLFQSFSNRFGSTATDVRINATSAPIEAVAGDYFEIYVYQNSGGALNIIGSYGESYNIFSAYKLSGSATMSATETVSALYTGAPPTGTLSAASNLVTFGTKVNDSHGGYASGIYTIQQSGLYDIETQFGAAGTYSVGQIATATIVVDGSTTIAEGIAYSSTSGSTTLYPKAVIGGYPLRAGQTVQIKSYCQASGTSFSAQAYHNHFSISKRK